MKKINYRYDEIKKFINANYEKDFKKISETGIEEYNDYFVDSVLGNKIFENEIEEFIYTLSICLVMQRINKKDEYFFNTLNELRDCYKSGKYDEFFFDINDKKEINKDLNEIYGA